MEYIYKNDMEGFIRVSSWLPNHKIKYLIDDNGNTILHTAIQCDNFEIFKYIVDNYKNNLDIAINNDGLTGFDMMKSLTDQKYLTYYKNAKNLTINKKNLKRERELY